MIVCYRIYFRRDIYMIDALLLFSLILILCIILTKVSNRTGLPMLLGFIGLGMLFGSDGIFKIPFDNYLAMEQIATVALIFIIFYGGFGTKWSTAKPVVVKATMLSTLGVVLTAFLVGIFAHYLLGMSMISSFLLGAVISSTDAASVFSILRSKKLNLKEGTASLLELESGSNDPASYMLTIIVLNIMLGDFSAGSFIYMLFAQVTYGLAFGALISYIALKVIQKVELSSGGMKMIFVVAIALFSYALPSYFGGNGFLSAYIVGIVLGNTQIEDKKSLVHFFDGITDLMQMVLFFLLGLLAFPSDFPEYIGYAMAIAIFLTFIARPISVISLLVPLKSSVNQQALVSFSGLRGAASIVFAIIAFNAIDEIDITVGTEILNIVFLVVLFSILFQGSLIPYVARKVNMIDDSEDVMKTFTDYSDEEPVKFISSTISIDHPWNNMAIKDIIFPPDIIIATLERGDKKIVPNGSTVLNAGDNLVLCAKAGDNVDGIRILEKNIDEANEFVGKKVANLNIEENMIIVMIKRQKEVIIPHGDTVIEKGDVLVINHS